MENPPSLPVSISRGSTLTRGVVLLLLLFLIVFGAVPHYLAGSWSGSTRPTVEGLKPLQALIQESLILPGWQTITADTVRIGEHEWRQKVMRQVSADVSSSAADTLNALPQEAVVLLRGQKGQRDRPQVEWTDLRGDRRWQEDSLSTLSVGTTKVRWLRVWWRTESGAVRTLAAAQWYAWPSADSPTEWTGHWSGNAWFWQDWQNQWQGQRHPWVAVAVLIPIEPLGDIAAVEPEARSLVEAIQAALATVEQ
ncbi:MAG: cyanoexosortase B system-associated protein [Prochlorotrichaceae cyanobacterium]